MNIMEPVAIGESNLISSNVPETDHPGWSAATTYAAGDRVIRNHRIYESVQSANTNHAPETDTISAWWLFVSATNRWKAFDKGLADPVTKTGYITYVLTFSKTCDAVALFSVDAAEVQIKITDPIDGVIHNETYLMADNSAVFDAWSYFFSPVVYSSDLVVRYLPIWSGVELEIQVISSGDTEVGEILVGNDHWIGRSLNGTSIGLQDYSIKDRDEFGYPQIVERGFTRTVEYEFSFLTSDVLRIQRIMSRIRSKVAVFSAGDGTDQYGTSIPGFYKDFNVPLSTNISFGTLEVESLL